MANFKEIKKTEELRIMVSPEEKNLILKYAENVGMKPSRLIRNLVLMEAEKKLKRGFYGKS